MKLGNYICHRKPERSFKIGGRHFPVCSRCTGIYLGTFSYYILVYWVYVEYNWVTIFMGCLMVIPTFIDGLTQLCLPRESNNAFRFSTGILTGIGLGIMVKAMKTILIF